MSEEEPRVRVCPYCYSVEITERVLIGGPMAQLDNDDGSCRCLKCGRTAVPMDFSGWGEYQAFLNNKTEVRQEGKVRMMPLLPALFEIGPDRDGTKACVVEIGWKDGLVLREHRAGLLEHWHRFEDLLGSKAACVLDVNGILFGQPDLDELQRLLRRRSEVMLDIGIDQEQDVYDSFTMGASMVLATSIGMRSIRVLENVLDMTEECIPCLCYDDRVRWRRTRGNPADLEESLEILSGQGFKEVALLDLRRLGGEEGPELRAARLAEKMGLKVWLGGGVTMEHVADLPENVSGVLLEPFPTSMR